MKRLLLVIAMLILCATAARANVKLSCSDLPDGCVEPYTIDCSMTQAGCDAKKRTDECNKIIKEMEEWADLYERWIDECLDEDRSARACPMSATVTSHKMFMRLQIKFNKECVMKAGVK